MNATEPGNYDISIEIDRLVFRGLTLSPERAERLRTLVELELQQLLGQGGGLEGMSGGEIAAVAGVRMDWPPEDDDQRLARSLAESIVQSLRMGG